MKNSQPKFSQQTLHSPRSGLEVFANMLQPAVEMADCFIQIEDTNEVDDYIIEKKVPAEDIVLGYRLAIMYSCLFMAYGLKGKNILDARIKDELV